MVKKVIESMLFTIISNIYFLPNLFSLGSSKKSDDGGLLAQQKK